MVQKQKNPICDPQTTPEKKLIHTSDLHRLDNGIRHFNIWNVEIHLFVRNQELVQHFQLGRGTTLIRVRHGLEIGHVVVLFEFVFECIQEKSSEIGRWSLLVPSLFVLANSQWTMEKVMDEAGLIIVSSFFFPKHISSRYQLERSVEIR